MTGRVKRSGLKSTPCLLLLLIFACLLVSSGILAPRLVTSKAEQLFGQPSPDLGSFQRLYLTALILLQSDDLTLPANPNGTETSLTILPGESVPSIIGQLAEAGLISNPGVFRSYLQYTGLDTSLKAGKYRLSSSMTPIEIAHAIQTSVSADVTLGILPGWRMEEIANSLTTTGLNVTPEAFMQAVQTTPEGYSFSSCLSNHTLEGFLFPDSYTIARQTTIDELLPQILMNFEAQVSAEIHNGFSSQGLNLCQAVTLASIVQREAMIPDEMPLIASVFYNRLNSGALLASDPTVQYALGYNPGQSTWWTNPLSLENLKVDSPYNTYIYQGLPPDPISNPGLDALKAVAFPAQTSYFYFRSACDGSGRHLFAETYDEHVANQCPEP